MSLLAEQTTTTAAEAFVAIEVAILPTGSTEQHGPALPLGTDHMIAETLAHTTIDREDIVVLPTIPVGVSDHHRQFHGTLWTKPEVFESFIHDVLASVASHGIRKAVVVNGHGGNTDALQRAARGLRAEEVAFAAPWNWWDCLDGLEDDLFGGFPGHADEVETSMMLRVAEELVREHSVSAAESGGAKTWGKRIHGANVGFDAIDFTDTGAVGNPTNGSAEAGDRLFEKARSELDALVDWLAEQPFEDLLPKNHT